MKKQKHLFDFEDYKEYLRQRAAESRGVKSALAEALNCQSAYISQVFNGPADLSLEQADATNKFFKHSEKESLFFLLLVQRERAGTPSLKAHFSQQLKGFKAAELGYLYRREIQNSLSETDQAIYYSGWEYNAIHMAITIPRLRTKASLLKAFEISEDKLNRCLEFLLEKGMIKRSGANYLPGTTENFLDSKSPFVRQFHQNTRLQAIQTIGNEALEEAHLSVVVTLSEKDVIKIKKILNEAISASIDNVKESKEEQIYGLTIDFFNMEK